MKQHIDFVITKTFYNLQSEQSRYYLNFLWWIFEPLLLMLVFYLVFDVLMQRGTENFLPFLLTGLTFWMWYDRSVSNAQNSIQQAKNLMMQVHLPKVVFPSIVLLQDSVKQVFVLSMLLVFNYVLGIEINHYWLALPLLILIQFIFIASVAFTAAAFLPFIPDLRFIVSALLRVQFFVSGIFFSPSQIPEDLQFLFFLNPMARFIQSYRDILLYQKWPDFQSLALIALLSTLLLLTMIWTINRLDHIYPRVVMR